MTMKAKTTKHLTKDRMDRVIFIATTIGFGEVIKEKKIEDDRGGRYEQLTDSGVIIIKDKDREAVITMFIARLNQAQAIYGEEPMPQWVVNTVKRNEKQKLMEKSEEYKARK